MYKKIFSLLTSIFIAVSFLSGCREDDGSGYTFKYNLHSNPQNLDPQLAYDEASINVIGNIMRGLVRKDSDGAVVADAAESYSISEDGLTYTFGLKDNIFWESEAEFNEKMTADDFVFAFRRIYDNSALFSPYYDDFLCIKNAEKAAAGEVPITSIGVTAPSSLTLQIELEYPCFDFLERLTLTGAMPCNESFFELTQGRYGLSAETTASNGAFFLKEWNYDPYWDNNYMILRRNKSNSETEFTFPYSINYFIKKGSDSDIEDFSKGDTDCVSVSVYDKKEFERNCYLSYPVKTYGLFFNLNSKYLASKYIREALSKSFVRSESNDPDYISGNGIIPPAARIMGRGYRELVSDESFNTADKEYALDLWNKALKQNNWSSVDGIKITVPEDFGAPKLISDIAEQWSIGLDFYCGVEVVSENEYELKLSDGSFDIALVENNSYAGTLSGYFDSFLPRESFACGNSSYMLAGKAMELSKAQSLGEAVDLYSEAERIILDSCVFIPVCYGNEYFLYDKNARDLVYDPITRSVDFRNGKYFD